MRQRIFCFKIQIKRFCVWHSNMDFRSESASLHAPPHIHFTALPWVYGNNKKINITCALYKVWSKQMMFVYDACSPMQITWASSWKLVIYWLCWRISASRYVLIEIKAEVYWRGEQLWRQITRIAFYLVHVNLLSKFD